MLMSQANSDNAVSSSTSTFSEGPSLDWSSDDFTEGNVFSLTSSISHIYVNSFHKLWPLRLCFVILIFVSIFTSGNTIRQYILVTNIKNTKHKSC